MEKKQKFGLLIFGLLLFVIGLIVCINTYSVKENTIYTYALLLTIAGVILLIAGIVSSIGKKEYKPTDTRILAQAALCAALCYIGATFLKIDVPVGTEKTMFHFGNVFCVVAALLIGGFWGGLAGAVGMTISDLTTAYVTSAPKTFLLKMCIGLIVGFFAHRVFHLSKEHTKRYVTIATVVSAIAGMVFNIIADPIVGYFYKTYLFGVPQDASLLLAKIGAITTSVNAIIAIVCASILYLALRPVMKKTQMLREF